MADKLSNNNTDAENLGKMTSKLYQFVLHAIEKETGKPFSGQVKGSRFAHNQLSTIKWFFHIRGSNLEPTLG